MAKVYAQDDNAWIIMDEACITDGSCQLNIYKTLQIRQETAWNNSAGLFVQDIFLASTFFVGTLAALGLIISGFMMILWWANESQFEKWKKWLKYSIIGMILVILSYTAIRLVQFIAQWQR